MEKELEDFLKDTVSAINFYRDDIISDEGLKKVVVRLLEALQINEAQIRNLKIDKKQ